MTPHDSTRCAVCVAPENCAKVGRCLALPTEGVGAVDALERHCDALLDFESALREDGFTLFVDEYVHRLREIREEGARLHEQVATLTDRLAAQSGWDENERIAALEAELAALRAPRADAGAVAWMTPLGESVITARTKSRAEGDEEYLRKVSRLHTIPLYAAPVPSGVTELQVQLAATALIAEVFALTQPADGDVFSWVDDHREQIARAALTAALAAAEQGGR